jgi:hypothetical protein
MVLHDQDLNATGYRFALGGWLRVTQFRYLILSKATRHSIPPGWFRHRGGATVKRMFIQRGD